LSAEQFVATLRRQLRDDAIVLNPCPSRLLRRRQSASAVTGQTPPRKARIAPR